MKHTYIICEIGVNHNGDVKLAREMMKRSKECGCDAVKFQAYKTENLVKKDTFLADYQKNNLTKDKSSQFNMLNKYELKENDFIELKKMAESLDVDFLVTPFDAESLKYLSEKLKLNKIKVSSADLNNFPLLLDAIKLNMSVILSTGMATLEDIKSTVKYIEQNNGHIDGILHCTTSYPTQWDDVNLNVIDTYKKEFSYPIGYSDHTIGDLIPLGAVAKGAAIIEKHVTLSRNFEGPDHKASMEFDDLKVMIEKIRTLEISLGDGVKKITDIEIKNKNIAIKKIVAKCDIHKGHTLSYEDFNYLRSNNGIEVKYVHELIGKKCKMEIKEGEPVLWEMIVSD